MGGGSGGGTTKTKQVLSKSQKELMNLVIPHAKDWINSPTKLPPNMVNQGLNSTEQAGVRQLMGGAAGLGQLSNTANDISKFFMGQGDNAAAGGQAMMGLGSRGAQGGLNGLLNTGGYTDNGLKALSGYFGGGKEGMGDLLGISGLGAGAAKDLRGMGDQGQRGLAGLLKTGNTTDQALKRISSGEFLNPNSQLLRSQTDAAVRPIQQRLERQIMPGISAGALKSGMFGSSRQGIAEGLAMSDFSKQALDASSNIQNNNFTQGLQGMMQAAQLGGQARQTVAGTGAQALGTAGQLGSQAGGQLLNTGAGAAGQMGQIGAGAYGQAAGTGMQGLSGGTNALGNLALQSLMSAPGLSGLALAPGLVQGAAGQQQRAADEARRGELNQRFTMQDMMPFLKAQDVAQLAMGMGGGSTQVSGGQPQSSGLQNAVGVASILASLASFSDERLKEDIQFERMEGRHKVYSFRYKGQEERTQGLIAQEVEQYAPEAVFEVLGYKAINYVKLGEAA